MSPVQDQMLQLQNQSLMLNFGQLVQAVTRQQGDIQYLQQQVQALHLQVGCVVICGRSWIVYQSHVGLQIVPYLCN